GRRTAPRAARSPAALTGPAPFAARRATRTTTGAAAAEALLHVLELLLLLVGEDLGQPAVHLLLQFLHLLFLFGRQLQRVLKERRHDLAGLRRPAEAAAPAPTRPAEAGAAEGPAAEAPAAEAPGIGAAEVGREHLARG